MMAAVAHSATCTWGAGRVPTASKVRPRAISKGKELLGKVEK